MCSMLTLVNIALKKLWTYDNAKLKSIPKCGFLGKIWMRLDLTWIAINPNSSVLFDDPHR